MADGGAKKSSKRPRDDPSTLFIRNLHPETTTTPFEAHVSSLVGPVRRCVIVNDPEGKCRGYGFIQFALKGDAERGLGMLDGGIYKGRKMKVETAKVRMRRGGRGAENGALDIVEDRESIVDKGRKRKRETSEEQKQRKKKKRVVGSVGMRTVVVRWREKGKPLLVSYAQGRLKGEEGGKFEGLETIAGSADGCEIRCIFDSWPLAGKGAALLHCVDKSGPEAYVEALHGGKRCRLIVRNLPYEVNPVAFQSHFEVIGAVREVNIPPRKPRKNGQETVVKDTEKVSCNGFAFVEYFLAADAGNAISKLNGSKIEGRVCAVDLAISKTAYDAKVAEEAKDAAELKQSGEKLNHREGKVGLKRGVDEDEEDKDRSNQIPKRPRKEAKSSPEELGCTVFVRNLSYETSSDELRSCFSEAFGKVSQCVLVMDKITGRPRGTAFVRFAEIEAAEAAVASCTGELTGLAAKFPNLAKPQEQVMLSGRKLLISFAVNREVATTLKSSPEEKHQKKTTDSRNIHLASVGHVIAGMTEAKGLSGSDLAKRATAYKAKQNKLAHNPNAFVSATRLSIRNLPREMTEADLKILFGFAATYKKWKGAEKVNERSQWRSAKVIHTKIVRDDDRKGRSKGFGFVSFANHEDAMAALHMMNNNPDVGKMLNEQGRMSELRKIGIEKEDDLKRKAKKQIDKSEARLQALQRENQKLWNGRRLVVEFAVEDRRVVEMIDKVKSKGRELKMAKKNEQSETAEDKEKEGHKQKGLKGRFTKGNDKRLGFRQKTSLGTNKIQSGGMKKFKRHKAKGGRNRS